MTRYAADTDVSTDRSLTEIQATLRRYGAKAFGYGWQQARAAVEFEMHDRHVRFLLPLPDPEDDEFWAARRRVNQHHVKEIRRSPADAERRWEQACRQRWRALALVIKAKLEAVESGITEFEDEFGMFVVLPDGSQLRDHVKPALAQAYERGMPDAGMFPELGSGVSK